VDWLRHGRGPILRPSLQRNREEPVSPDVGTEGRSRASCRWCRGTLRRSLRRSPRRSHRSARPRAGPRRSNHRRPSRPTRRRGPRTPAYLLGRPRRRRSRPAPKYSAASPRAHRDSDRRSARCHHRRFRFRTRRRGRRRVRPDRCRPRYRGSMWRYTRAREPRRDRARGVTSEDRGSAAPGRTGQWRLHG
jgi:hypothetical protein